MLYLLPRLQVAMAFSYSSGHLKRGLPPPRVLFLPLLRLLLAALTTRLFSRHTTFFQGCETITLPRLWFFTFDVLIAVAEKNAQRTFCDREVLSDRVALNIARGWMSEIVETIRSRESKGRPHLFKSTICYFSLNQGNQGRILRKIIYQSMQQ